MPLTVTPLHPDLPTSRVVLQHPDLLEPATDPGAELDRQIALYVALGVTEAAGLTPETLAAAVGPLRTVLDAAVGGPSGASDPEDAVPFVLVLDVDPNDAAPAMVRRGLHGVSVIGRDEAEGYRPIDGVDVPRGRAYLLLDVDTGSDLCGVRPEDALVAVRARGRTPLTMAEGIALTTIRPDMLRPNRCYSLMGSRAGNQRVPAIWISDRRVKLGWCWDRNPHTWLGAASAGARRGASPVASLRRRAPVLSSAGRSVAGCRAARPPRARGTSPRRGAGARARRASTTARCGACVPQEHSIQTEPSGSVCRVPTV